MSEPVTVYIVTRGRGAGCYLDAPGYPSYTHEVRIITRYGNGKRSGKRSDDGVMSIDSAIAEDYVSAEAKRQARELIDAWRANRPALDSERCKLWRAHVYLHFHNCYLHPTEQQYSSRKLIIYPVPEYTLPRLPEFGDDSRFNDEWRMHERAAVEAKRTTIQAERDAIIEPVRAIATINNHAAVVRIRKFYPEFDPAAELDAIMRPRPIEQADWWETMEHPPATDEECRATCRNGIRSDHAEVDRSVRAYKEKVRAAGAAICAGGGIAAAVEAKKITLPLHCRWCGYGLEDGR